MSTPQVNIRFPETLTKRIDRLVVALGADMPAGAKIDRSSLIRAYVEQKVSEEEKRLALPPL